jgi:hypothetical protein
MTVQQRFELRAQAKEIWFEVTKRGRVKPTTKQRDILNQAYWAGVLPNDRDYSVDQWVEDNYPIIGG